MHIAMMMTIKHTLQIAKRTIDEVSVLYVLVFSFPLLVGSFLEFLTESDSSPTTYSGSGVPSGNK